MLEVVFWIVVGAVVCLAHIWDYADQTEGRRW